jgi:amino acid adenylation domain-containing protein
MSGDTNQAGLVAIIGMSGRFPGAPNLDAFWNNLVQGVDSTSGLAATEISGDSNPSSTGPVSPSTTLVEVDRFDAAFFSITPLEAAVLDPQQRLMLEVAWEALENSGYDPLSTHHSIGIWAGMGTSPYFERNVLRRTDVIAQTGLLQAAMGNRKDYLATRVSYKLGLTGPSINVFAGDATSSVSVAEAFASLLRYQCDIALAGGVSITMPESDPAANAIRASARPGTDSHPGDVESATPLADGIGMVVLKRFDDAKADGDYIYALIRGVATTSNGSRCSDSSGERIQTRADAIAMAHAMAGVRSDSIALVEVSGSSRKPLNTALLAPLELVFQGDTDRRHFCALGSVAGNVGRLSAASGIAGLIKAALALKHRIIPPNLNGGKHLLSINSATCPFFVNEEPLQWPEGDHARRAGVSLFAESSGAANVHVVLEEPPAAPEESIVAGNHLLLLSARTTTALDRARSQLAQYLAAIPNINMNDVAWTLRHGRRAFDVRQAVVCANVGEAIDNLNGKPGGKLLSGRKEKIPGKVAFLFPGQGSQYANMALELLQKEPLFATEFSTCARILEPILGLDIRTLVYPTTSNQQESALRLQETAITQPILFAIEYALAQLWMSWGVEPVAMIGHSLGEYVAACLAGVFAIEEALAIVAERGRLMQAQPRGSMLAVRLPLAELEPLLPTDLVVAGLNAPQLNVVSGSESAVAAFRQVLVEKKIESRPLATSHGFHSPMMEGALQPFYDVLSRHSLRQPTRLWISCVTGDWVTREQAIDPSYWVSQLRQPVRFSDGVKKLLDEGHCTMIEVGPGHALSTLVRQQPNRPANHLLVSSLGREAGADIQVMLTALGALYTVGIEPNWTAIASIPRGKRIPLPTYSFDRKRCWLDASDAQSAQADETALVDEDGSGLGATQGQAESKVAKRIRKVLSDCSGIPPQELQPAQTFLELGFDSLLMTRVSSALEKAFGVPISFRQLMEAYCTLETLSAHLESKVAERGDTPSDDGESDAASVETTPESAEPIPEGLKIARDATGNLAWYLPDPERPGQYVHSSRSPTENASPDVVPSSELPEGNSVPLSDAQQELWTVVEMGPEASCAYNLCICMSLRGNVAIEPLRCAIEKMFVRHEALRTRFAAQGGTQSYAPPGSLDVPVVDLGGLSEAERRAREQRILDEEVGTALDLVNGPCARVKILVETRDSVRVVLTAHHIICDGWTTWLFYRDLATIYAAERQGKSAALPPAVPFFRQLVREASREGRAHAAGSLRYWQQQFSGGAPTLELPADRPRPPIKTYSGARADRDIITVTNDDVTHVAGRLGATSVGVLLAAFQALLLRLTGQTDIVVGLPLSARHPADRDGLAGHVTNLLPIRAKMDREMTFTDLVNATRGALLDAQEYQALTFGTLIPTLRLHRETGRVSLVSVMFNVDRGRDGHQWVDAVPELTVAPRRFVNFDIELQLPIAHNKLRLEAAYNSDLFSGEAVHRWLGHYEVLLAHALAHPETPLAELPLLTDAERATFEQWNATHADFDRNASIARLVEQQAQRTPDRIAIRFGEQTIRYGELEAKANQWSHALRRLGVGRGALVGLCLERSLDVVPALLAVLKVGAGYIPLDPAFPAERLAFMVEDSRLSLVISDSKLREVHRAPLERTLELDKASGELERESPEPLHDEGCVVSGDDVAYVLYTSGSTGKPKGVRVHHRAATNFLTSMQREPGLSQNDRLLAVTTLSFDIALLELMLPLSVGAEIVLASRDQAMDGAILRQLLESREVTAMQATPATWRLLIDSGWKGHPKFKALCGGEPLPPDLAEALLQRVGELWNMYGPTETTVWSSCWRVHDPRQGIPIGRPISNTTFWILDPNQQICPVGVSGEIYIGGDGVSLGYLNRPELTRERFIPDPFSSTEGARLYRTGDLGRWRADGLLECQGRTDFQVKVRGFRIELGEIESLLSNIPSIRQAVVVARQDTTGDARLVAYLVAQDGQADEPALRKELRRALPDYMIPQHFVVLESFPLTPNGKVDKKQLPAPSASAAAPRVIEEPRNARERELIEIWKRVLGAPQVDVTADFFDLGGHSLLAVRILNEMNAAYGVRLPLATFFNHSTVRALAAKLETLLTGPSNASAHDAWSTVVPMRTSGTLPPLFCVAGVGGNPMNFRGLADALGQEQPFYGIQHRGVDGVLSPHASISDMAAESINDMKAVQPNGPYFVAGYSVGGLVAYEMAMQLKRAGEEVGGVILLDTFNPTILHWTLSYRIGSHLENLKKVGPSYITTRAMAATRRVIERVKHERSVARAKAGAYEDRLALVTEACLQAEKQYEPPAGDMNVTLIKAIAILPPAAGILYPPHESNGWEGLVRGTFEIRLLDCQHLDMLSAEVVPAASVEISTALQRLRELANSRG